MRNSALLFPVIVAPLAVGVTLTLVACGDGPQAVPGTEPLTLQKADPSGDNQTDTVLATLANPLRVVVRRGNDPVEGVTVEWRLYGSPMASTTDSLGIASASFTLGSGACEPRPDRLPLGTYLAGAFLPTGWPSVSFSATASPGKPVQLIASDGGKQVGVSNTLLAPYTVYATDRHGNRVGGVAIDWAVAGDRGTISPTQTITSGSPGACGGPATAWFTLGPDQGISDTVFATASTLPGAPAVTFVSTPVSALGHVVSIGFAEDTITVSHGETVGWRWNTNECDYWDCWSTPHSVTFDDAPEPPASSAIQTGGTHTRTFPTPGVYAYHCTVKHDVPHAGGVVVVR